MTVHGQTTSGGSMLVLTDLPCQMKLDGDYKGEIPPGEPKRFDVAAGDHLAQCKSGDTTKDHIFTVQAGTQKIVRFSFSASEKVTPAPVNAPNAPPPAPAPFPSSPTPSQDQGFSAVDPLFGRYEGAPEPRRENRKTTKDVAYFTDTVSRQLNVVARTGSLYEGWMTWRGRSEMYDRSTTFSNSGTPVTFRDNYSRVQIRMTTGASGELTASLVYSTSNGTKTTIEPETSVYRLAVLANGELQLQRSNGDSTLTLRRAASSPDLPPGGVGLDSLRTGAGYAATESFLVGLYALNLNSAGGVRTFGTCGTFRCKDIEFNSQPISGQLSLVRQTGNVIEGWAFIKSRYLMVDDDHKWGQVDNTARVGTEKTVQATYRIRITMNDLSSGHVTMVKKHLMLLSSQGSAGIVDPVFGGTVIVGAGNTLVFETRWNDQRIRTTFTRQSAMPAPAPPGIDAVSDLVQ